jgi:hypothetical protein
MPKLITLPTHMNKAGKINVIEKVLPFQIKRVYWIYDILKNRSGHSHKTTIQGVVPIKGSCNILIKKKNFEKNFFLDNNNQLLILEPEDWHLIENCSKDLVLLVLASEDYDINDYIDEPLV